MNGDLLWVQKAGKCLDVYYVSHIGVCNFAGNLIPKVGEFFCDVQVFLLYYLYNHKVLILENQPIVILEVSLKGKN